MRLGLILSDIGQSNELKVEQNEINAAVMAQARRYPGQEQKVVEFFRSNPQAVEQLRAPLYEDKVVDFILQMATRDRADRAGRGADARSRRRRGAGAAPAAEA